MPQDKKFIIVNSDTIAKQMVDCGFILLSKSCGTYTFINSKDIIFNFSSVSKNEIHFTNKINI